MMKCVEMWIVRVGVGVAVSVEEEEEEEKEGRVRGIRMAEVNHSWAFGEEKEDMVLLVGMIMAVCVCCVCIWF